MSGEEVFLQTVDVDGTELGDEILDVLKPKFKSQHYKILGQYEFDLMKTNLFVKSNHHAA